MLRVLKNRNYVLLWIAQIVSGLGDVLYLVGVLVFALSLSVLFGPPSSIRDVAQDALLQTTVSEDMLGRVYALRGTFKSLMLMLSGILFAWLADAIPIRMIYITGGIMYVLTAIYAMSYSSLRRSQAGIEAALPDRDTAFCHCLENAKHKTSVEAVEALSL